LSVLETERLRLRPFRDDDLDVVARWLADPEFTRYLAGPQPRAEAEAILARAHAHWREHGFGPFAVEDRATGELIGRSGPAYHRAWPHDPEVGWWIAPERQGRGLATEAGSASVRHTFDDLGFARVVSITIEPNLASRRVMEKLGFRLLERIPTEWGELWVHALDAPEKDARGT
jgi:RimJ/RimL family protein N-acetyltransferase